MDRHQHRLFTLAARTLGSVEEIREAARKGEVTLKQAGVVVNMPILVWPGGQR